MNADFQRTARKDEEAFLHEQCKDIEENSRMRENRELSRKLEISRQHCMQDWT